MTVENDEKLISEVWGSVEAFYEFAESEVQRLGPLICGCDIVLPRVELDISEDPMTALFGKNHSSRTASYDYDVSSPLCRNGLIKVFPPGYASRDYATLAIAHELIHHWERINPESKGLRYPKSADEIVKQIFPDTLQEKLWRKRHSRKFISKAAKVAKSLNIPLREILFHVIKRKPTGTPVDLPPNDKTT